MNTDRVWATIGGEDSGKDGGIFRSDDAGKTWKLLNNTFEITSRQYYYGHIFADTQKLDVVYTFSSKSFYKSTDGGKTWDGRVQTPHSDYHDLWIDPHDDQRMINGNDGGATITFDGGRSWSSEMNQPTGQFYTVRADSGFPYRVYGAQQDDTTVSMSKQSVGRRARRRGYWRRPLRRSRRRRERLCDSRLAGSERRVCGRFLGIADAVRPQGRKHAQHHGLAGLSGRAHRLGSRSIGSSGRFR